MFVARHEDRPRALFNHHQRTDRPDQLAKPPVPEVNMKQWALQDAKALAAVHDDLGQYSTKRCVVPVTRRQFSCGGCEPDPHQSPFRI